MSHPTVNLNGTSQRELVDQACTVIHALVDLQRAHALASPHGRDYQISVNGTFDAACAVHGQQAQSLRSMLEFWRFRVELLEEGGK